MSRTQLYIETPIICNHMLDILKILLFFYKTVKPTITSFSSNPVKPVLGGSFTITCEASGRPEPTYTIIYNGTTVVSTQKTYTKSGVSQDDAGTYMCNAANPLGSDSKSFSLIVGTYDCVELIEESIGYDILVSKVQLLRTGLIIYSEYS